MTLPASGSISVSAINTEFSRGNNLNAYRGTSWFTDSGSSGSFSSGAISMSDFYSKRLTAPTFSFTISSAQTNANLRTLALNAGWNGSNVVVATIGSGVYISSNSTGTPALTINGSFPNGVHLINNGAIIGMGGAGGGGFYGAGPAYDGSAGGLALSVSVAVTITNNNTIGGGGGGGGGGPGRATYDPKGGWSNIAFTTGGGGGRSSAAANSAGGSAYLSGYAGTVSSQGGGRDYYGNPSGAGGSWGAGGGGGYASDPGASWGNYTNGGAGGYAVSGNGYISWAATGTRLGGIA